jgi:hypothetical protein
VSSEKTVSGRKLHQRRRKVKTKQKKIHRGIKGYKAGGNGKKRTKKNEYLL